MNRARAILLVLVFAANVCCASEEVTLGIMPFLSRTSEFSRADASEISNMFANILQEVPGISVIDRKHIEASMTRQDFKASGDDANIKAGRLAGCRYIILGTVTSIMKGTSSRGRSSTTFINHRAFTTMFNAVKESTHHTASIEARLIDTETGIVVLSFKCSGSVSGENGKTEPVSVMLAVKAAACGVADKARGFFTGEYPTVTYADKSGVVINRGARSGVIPGMLYRIYQDGAEMFDLNGNSLGRKTVNLSVVRVTQVNSKACTAEVLSNSNLISIGNKAEIISIPEAKKLKLSVSRL